jgi:hypothetical protein
MQDPRVIAKGLDVLFGLPVLQLTYLSLSKPKPTPEKFLVQRLAEQMKVTRMIAVRLEDLSNVLTFEGDPELVGLEELVAELGWRCAELVALLPVAPAAESRVVVRRERGSTSRAAPVTANRATPLRTG